MKTKILAILIAITLSLPTYASSIHYHWDSPTDGGTIDYYEMQIQTDEAPWVTFTNTTLTSDIWVEMPYGSSIVRVRGVGPGGEGPWSPVSEVHIEYQEPGMCGRPIKF
jgi:hypothetical protein